MLARAVLNLAGKVAGFDFASLVDTCGGNLWIWHRDAAANGFERLKAADGPLVDVPCNAPATGKRRNPQQEIYAAQVPVELTEAHKFVINAIRGLGYVADWREELGCLHTHSAGLKALIDDDDKRSALGLVGVFNTVSRGTDTADPQLLRLPA